MTLSRIRVRNYGAIAGMIILLLYDFHRYIFKYNSEGTSPTYTNTPLVWKVGKYVLLTAAVALFFSGIKYTLKVNRWFWYIYGVIAVILVINLVNFIIYGVFDTEETEYCFWFALLIPYWFTEESVFNFKFNYHKLIIWSMAILYASNIIAIANYYFTGRLPALGYEGGLVRFGGFWDDPNSFGIICTFFFYYFIKRGNYLVAALSIINIVLTFSFTAYFLLFLSIGFWIFTSYVRYNIKWLLFGVGVVAVIGAFVLVYFDALSDLYQIKAESVNEHLTQKMIFNPIPLLNAPIQFSENWYESSFYNYFPFSILIHLGFLILLLSLFLSAKNKDLKFFFFLFIVASFFFSMLYTFPLNFLFIFLLIDYIKDQGITAGKWFQLKTTT
jgi:hypothetical protein